MSIIVIVMVVPWIRLASPRCYLVCRFTLFGTLGMRFWVRLLVSFLITPMWLVFTSTS